MIFSKKLTRWYEKNKRDLPWRDTQDPYYIWLSEIILQQTRVEQGLPYYLKFVKQFPTIKHLAKANEDEVLKLWQGLGYYTRARNLHYTAKIICENRGEKFPENYEEILKLKGIGAYTAAAIASFAFDLPHPVVDGNVQRVFARIFGISEAVNSSSAERKFYALAEKLIDRKNPSTFNQAMMEFGAIHCTPINPKCEKCIFRENCIAFKTNRVQELPFKEKKSKPRNRYFNYLVIQTGDTVFLNKRNKNDIWKNLYEFPLIESGNPLSKKEIITSAGWEEILGKIRYNVDSISKTHKHILSHQRIYACFWEVSISEKSKSKIPDSFLEIKKTEIKQYAVPRLIERYLEGRR